MVEWSEVSQEEFEQHPSGNRSPEDLAWDQVMRTLAGGKAVKLPFGLEIEKRSLRLSVAKRAANRGLKLEVREGDGYLLVRKERTPRRKREPAETPTVTTRVTSSSAAADRW